MGGRAVLGDYRGRVKDNGSGGRDMHHQLELLLGHMSQTIGHVPASWPQRPPGYPGQVEAALIDAVFSLRAVYGQSSSVGPRAVVERWRRVVDRPLDSLRSLVDDVDRMGGPGEFPRVLKHDGVAVPSAPDRPSKALAVYTSASALVDAGVIDASDAVKMRSTEPKRLLRAVQTGRGVGPQAATYFLMNLGQPGVKVDVMVKRFVHDGLNYALPDHDVAELVASAAKRLDADVIRLDHAIWKYQSDQARLRPRRKGRAASEG